MNWGEERQQGKENPAGQMPCVVESSGDSGKRQLQQDVAVQKLVWRAPWQATLISTQPASLAARVFLINREARCL